MVRMARMLAVVAAVPGWSCPAPYTGGNAVAQKWMDAHNVYRCMHGAPGVTWSDAVYENGHEHFKDQRSHEHSDAYNVPPPAGPAGENLFWASWHASPDEVVTAWYDEVSKCSWSNGCHTGRGAVGHFTALIWHAVKEIGCEVNAHNVAFCRYRAGDRMSCETPNMLGCYVAQVHQQKNSKAECAAAVAACGGSSPSPSPPAPSGFTYGRPDTNECNSGDTKIGSAAECQQAAAQLGLAYNGEQARSDRPGGCWVGSASYANYNPLPGSARARYAKTPICARGSALERAYRVPVGLLGDALRSVVGCPPPLCRAGACACAAEGDDLLNVVQGEPMQFLPGEVVPSSLYYVEEGVLEARGAAARVGPGALVETVDGAALHARTPTTVLVLDAAEVRRFFQRFPQDELAMSRWELADLGLHVLRID